MIRDKIVFKPNMENEAKCDYELQALQFLTATDTIMTIEYDRRDRYFINDKGLRDVYWITLQSGSISYMFEFGNSLHDTEKNIAPNAYDILACCYVMEFMDYDDFCLELGYTEDNGYERYVIDEDYDGYYDDDGECMEEVFCENPELYEIFEKIEEMNYELNRLYNEKELEMLQEIA